MRDGDEMSDRARQLEELLESNDGSTQSELLSRASSNINDIYPTLCAVVMVVFPLKRRSAENRQQLGEGTLTTQQPQVSFQSLGH